MKEIKVLYIGPDVFGALDLKHGTVYRGLQWEHGCIFVEDEFLKRYNGREELVIHENCYCVPTNMEELFKILE